VKGNYNREGLSEKSGDGLSTAVQKWPTPKASNGDKAGRPRENDWGDLQAAVLRAEGQEPLWPTASARDWKSSASNMHDHNARPLNEVVRLWSTPTDRDGYSGPGYSETAEGTANLRTQANGALNPFWVEALMGFPAGWTDIGGPLRRARTSTRGSRPAPSAEEKSPTEPSG
jgi:hypothetical protein